MKKSYIVRILIGILVVSIVALPVMTLSYFANVVDQAAQHITNRE